MKMIILILFIFSTLGLIACSNQAPIIVKEETNKQNDDEITLIEQEIDDSGEKEIEQIIEFSLPENQISLHISQIPILENYLAKHNNREQAIEQMELVQLDKEGLESLFVLTFACNDDACSYLLLNTDTEQSQLLADNATVQTLSISPDGDNLLIIFERPLNEQSWEIHKMMVFDLNAWAARPLLTDAESILPLNQFRWPIIDAVWQDASTINLTLPAVDEPTPTNLTDWIEKSEETKQIKISIE